MRPLIHIPLTGLALIAIPAAPLPAAESLFAPERTGNQSGPENQFYELGTVFRATLPGTVTHLRVYALATETGTHTARLWRNDTGAVISGPHLWTYSGSGWITLDIPDVSILAATDYTVAVTTGATNGAGDRPYPFRAGDLATPSGNGANLIHPASAGVFSTTAGARPENTFNSANYYRDVIFEATPPEGYVADTEFSVRRGFFTNPVNVAITCATPGAEIHYTLNGATPSETSPLYTAPLNISTTTTLRARAFRPNWVPTNTDTNTYIFPASVIAQTNATALAYGWPTGPVNGQVLRYGTDSPAAALYAAAQKITALTQVPAISIVTDQEYLTGAAEGVYVNAEVPEFERPGSVELIHPDGSEGFQIDCGLRQRGGQSRGDSFPKKSWNFFFRTAYGPGKLRFPLFGADGAREFDTLSLRCEHGYAYADPYPLGVRLDFTGLRDVFNRDLRGASGFQTTRSRPYHLYLNGQYWGLYETQERTQEDFGATYFGGTPEEYDGIASTGLPQRETEVISGTIDAWQALWSGARAVNAGATAANYFALLGRNGDGTPNPDLPVLLDPRELASYMLLHYYTGHADAPLSVSFNYERPNNFRCLRRRDRTDPWHFFVHDSESSTRAAQWDADRVNDNAAALTSPNRNDIRYSNPEWIHEDLLASAEYRIAFADEAQRLLLNDGPFTVARALAVWNARAASISEAVIGESIRWAQSSQENQANWNAEVNDVRNNFFATRSATVLAQLRTRGIYPAVDAPAFSQRGGQVAAGFHLTLSAAAGGTIYVTTDGSDPRAIGGAPAVPAYAEAITISAPVLVRARYRSTAGAWSAEDHAFFTTFAPATAANLALVKIHYNPPPPTAAELAAGFNDDNDFEYLEFQNSSGATIDLRGVQVNAGVGYTFPALTLAAGARVVIAENAAAFAFRYSFSPAGAFTGNLSNGGETLRVVDAAGASIVLVIYDDRAPWPELPDGNGPCLMLRAANLDPALPANWRASYVNGGKPGAEDILTLADWRAEHFTAGDLADPAKEATLWGNLANPDGDDAANLLEYALAASPMAAASVPRIVTGNGHAVFFIREGTTGITVTPEMSGDMQSWQPLTPLSTVSQGDNTVAVTVPLALSANPRRFLRVRVTAP
ncbi:MAG: chitobiase/beta-hexosaminidase C-terminal domain-containing protein [Verrucomicrobiales bacterium]